MTGAVQSYLAIKHSLAPASQHNFPVFAMAPKPRAKAKARAFVSRYDADMDISGGIPCTECEGRTFQTWGQLTLHMFRQHGIRLNELGAWVQQQRTFERRPELLDITEDEMEHIDDVPGEPEQFKCIVCLSLGANNYVFQKRNASTHFAKVHRDLGLDTSRWLVVADGHAIKNGAPQNLRLSAALAKHRPQPDAETRPTDGEGDQSPRGAPAGAELGAPSTAESPELQVAELGGTAASLEPQARVFSIR